MSHLLDNDRIYGFILGALVTLAIVASVGLVAIGPVAP